MTNALTQSETRPALVLDIDGVFVLSSEIAPPEYKRLPSPHHYDSYNLNHAKWLAGVLAATEPYYISDWGIEDLCHERIGRHLQFPKFPWINSFGFSDYELSRRARAITAHFPGRPVVWVDDELSASDHAWASTRSQNEAPTLLIHTDKRRGLEAFQVSAIEKWLGQLALDRRH